EDIATAGSPLSGRPSGPMEPSGTARGTTMKASKKASGSKAGSRTIVGQLLDGDAGGPTRGQSRPIRTPAVLAMSQPPPAAPSILEPGKCSGDSIFTLARAMGNLGHWRPEVELPLSSGDQPTGAMSRHRPGSPTSNFYETKWGVAWGGPRRAFNRCL